MPRKTGNASGPKESLAAPTCDRLWTVHEVSVFLGVPIATLHQWRYLGTGPAAFRVGRHLRYDPDVVRRWLVENCTGVA
jgi:hypothetical protein